MYCSLPVTGCMFFIDAYEPGPGILISCSTLEHLCGNGIPISLLSHIGYIHTDSQNILGDDRTLCTDINNLHETRPSQGTYLIFIPFGYGMSKSEVNTGSST
jgi:hypothetical protein